MIVEISRLAQHILYDEDSVSAVAPEDLVVEQQEMAVDTHELSFLKTDKTAKEESFEIRETSLVRTEKMH